MGSEPSSEPRRFREVGRPLTRPEACWLLGWGVLALADFALHVHDIAADSYAWFLRIVVWLMLLYAALFVPRALLGRRYIELGPDGLRDVFRLGRCRVIGYEHLRSVTSGGRDRYGVLAFEIGTGTEPIRLDTWLSGWPDLLAEIWRRQPSIQIELPDGIPARLRGARDGVTIAATVSAPAPGPLRYAFAGRHAWMLVACGLVVIGAVGGLLLHPWPPTPHTVTDLSWPLVVAALTLWDWRANRARVRVEIRPDRLMLTDGSGRVHDVPWGELVDYSAAGLPGPARPVILLHARRETLRWPILLRGAEWLGNAATAALGTVDNELAARQS